MIVPVTVAAVVFREDGTRTVEVNYPACSQKHCHIWPVGQSVIGYRMMACRQGVYEINIPAWAFDPRHRTGYAKYVADKSHSVLDRERQ